MHWSLTLVIFCTASVAQAANHPKWTDMAALFGQSKKSDAVTAFVRNYGLREATRGPSGAFTPDDRAYSLLYRESCIDTIVFQVGPFAKGYGEKHWKPYAEKLPGNLSSSDGRAQVIKKLGAPVKGRKSTWKHGALYIWVIFDGKQRTVHELYVSPHPVEAKK